MVRTGIRRLDEYVAARNKADLPASQLARNVLLAKRPEFVIIGTGRSGTTFAAKHFGKAGVLISHEQYFTYKGPYLRNPSRDWRTRGEASWLAVPYLPDARMPALHQVREPLAVIGSLFKIGFFDPAFHAEHQPFIDFAKRHFTVSEEPLHSSLRWYIEWNQRCEAITDCRYRVEDFGTEADRIEGWLGLNIGLKSVVSSPKINSRPAVVDDRDVDLARDLKRYPEYPALVDMCRRYGYSLD